MSNIRTPDFVVGELKNGESIVWQGQPDTKYAFCAGLPLFGFAIIFAFFVGHFLSFESHGLFDSAFSIFSLLTFIPVIGVCLAPLLLARRASQMFYTLTNERVLIITNGRRRQIASYERSSLTPLFKMDFAGKSHLVWQAPGMSRDNDGRSSINKVIFYAVDLNTSALMGVDFPAVSTLSSRMR